MAKKLDKITVKDWPRIKRCPNCKTAYRVDFSSCEGHVFRCETCGGEVTADNPDRFYYYADGVRIIAKLILLAVIFLGIPAGLIFGIYSCMSSDAGSGGHPEIRSSGKRKDKIDAWVFTQYFVESKLRAPKTADFPFGGAQKHVTETVPGIFIIDSYVDSQNGFGAVVRQHFFCKLSVRNDGKFEVIQFSFK